MAIDNSVNIYINDKDNNRIEKFDPNGMPLYQFGSFGLDPVSIVEVQGIAVDSSGKIFVADTNGHKLMVFQETSYQSTPEFGMLAGIIIMTEWRELLAIHLLPFFVKLFPQTTSSRTNC